MNKQAGFSLVEIMIALLIGLFLMGGILQMFSASQQTYRMQSNLARLQENGRFALDFLARDLRMAGYWGCLSGLNSVPSITDIDGTDNNAVAGDDIDDGTDTIKLKGVFDLFVLAPPLDCEKPASTPGSCCKTDPSLTANICPNLVNCYRYTNSTLNYKINASVLQQDTGEVGDPTQVGDPNRMFNGMFEGIQDMQILYGVAIAPLYKEAAFYVPVYPAIDWPHVVSIRISLLVVTLDDNLTPQPIPYTYYVNNVLTNNIIPADRKIRRVLNTTIALRNNLP
jgi:type IV pilus assembly protein PilW